MWIITEHKEKYAVEVRLDTGSRENFITQEMARGYHLEPKKIPRPTTFDMVVGEVTCMYYIDVTWFGVNSRPDRAKFYVLPPDARIEMPLMGTEFINQFGDVLMDENPTSRRLIAYTAMKRKTVG